MAIIFGPETFEAGNKGAFDSDSGGWGTGNTLTYDNTSKLTGTYSIKLHTVAKGAKYCEEVITAASEIYVRFTYYCSSAWASGDATTIISMYDTGSYTNSIYLNIENAARNLVWGETLANSGGTDTGKVMPTSTKTTIQLYFKKSATVGNVKLWINNSVEASPDYDSGNVNTSAYTMTRFLFGNPYAANACPDYYMDDATLSTTFIGGGSSISSSVSTSISTSISASPSTSISHSPSTSLSSSISSSVSSSPSISSSISSSVSSSPSISSSISSSVSASPSISSSVSTSLSSSPSRSISSSPSRSISSSISPSPSGSDTIDWKGYTWDCSDGAGWGGENISSWSKNNAWVDGNGYLNLKISNPSGSAPIGAEITNQTVALGYGTYTCVIATRLDTLDENIVFGGMFPYGEHTTLTEFDVCETSKWNGDYSTVQIGHNSWYGPVSSPSVHETLIDIPSDVVQTHRLVWEAGRATFDSFLGTGTGGTNYFHTVYTSDIPTPNNEQVIFNIWAFSNASPVPSSDKDIPETTVIIRDFTYEASSPSTSLSSSVSTSLSTSISTSPSTSLSSSVSTSPSISISSSPSISSSISTSPSTSVSSSISTSISTSLSSSISTSVSSSISASPSISTSISSSPSTSVSTSISSSPSTSVSASPSISSSISGSVSSSVSASPSISTSISASPSISSSISSSPSTSISSSPSTSVSSSPSASPSISTSISSSPSTSVSTSISLSPSTSISSSPSISSSVSTSISSSPSTSISTSVSDSPSTSISSSPSTSISTSVSDSPSTSISSSPSTSISSSPSISSSISSSPSTSVSDSPSTSISTSPSTSISTSISTSPSTSISTSPSTSISSSPSTSVSTSISSSPSRSISTSISASPSASPSPSPDTYFQYNTNKLDLYVNGTLIESDTATLADYKSTNITTTGIVTVGASGLKILGSTYYGIFATSAASSNKTYTFPNTTGNVPLLETNNAFTGIITTTKSDTQAFAVGTNLGAPTFSVNTAMNNVGIGNLGGPGTFISIYPNATDSTILYCSNTYTDTASQQGIAFQQIGNAAAGTGNVRLTGASFSETISHDISGTSANLNQMIGVYTNCTSAATHSVVSSPSPGIEQNYGGYFNISRSGTQTGFGIQLDTTGAYSGVFGNARINNATAGVGLTQNNYGYRTYITSASRKLGTATSTVNGYGFYANVVNFGGNSTATHNNYCFYGITGFVTGGTSWFLYDGTPSSTTHHSFIAADNSKVYWGDAQDASIYYDATNLVINPKEVGSTAYVSVLGDVRAVSLYSSTLTATRVVFAGTSGQLVDDADMTFATDTLTVTKIVGSTQITSPALRLTSSTPTTLSGDVNDYDVGNKSFIRLGGGAADRIVTGILSSGVADGHIMFITNIGTTNKISFANESASSSAANRIMTSIAGTVEIPPAHTIQLIYDATSSRWRELSHL